MSATGGKRPLERVRSAKLPDGGTFWLADERIRIAHVGAPETNHAKCPSEHPLGKRAKPRLLARLIAGGAADALRIVTELAMISRIGTVPVLGSCFARDG
jgi:hypothetical protein